MDNIRDRLKDFDQSFGWLIRWGVLLLLGYAILYADSRYLKRDEVESYMEQLHKMRAEDMAQIYARIETVRADAVGSDAIVRKLESRMARIEEQNKMILNRLEHMGEE